MLHWLGGFARGLREKDQSIATGLLIGLIIWTLTHLVDSVTSNGSIEYATAYTNATLEDGTHVYQIEVDVSNLSSDTPIPNLEVSIQNPGPDHQASFYPAETSCKFQPPSWVGAALCDSHDDGGDLMVPLLVPGTSVSMAMKYLGSVAPSSRPIVRIRPGTVSNFRLITPGPATFITRYETDLLLGILVLSVLLFVISVSGGAQRTQKAAPKE
jgi:hypothetical protein